MALMLTLATYHKLFVCRFVYSISKITRFYDYQNADAFFGEMYEVHKGIWAFLSFLWCLSGVDWLERQTPVT